MSDRSQLLIRRKCSPGQHKLRVVLSDDITMRLECSVCDHVEYRPKVKR